MLFDVSTDEHDGWAVVRVIGEIDLASVPVLRQHLRLLRVDAVALDLTDAGYLDSVGVGVVLGAARRIRARGGRFVVLVAAGRIRDLLVDLGLDGPLDIVAELPAIGRG